MIVIVGAGLSGLALAHQLAARGQPYVVLEAADRVGGVMRSGRVEGRLLEWGPQRARLTREFRGLVDDLGLADRLIRARPGLPLFVYSHGALRLVPFSAGGLLRSDLLSTRGKLRMLLEPFTAGADDEESVAAFLRRKLGREAYERLAGPLYGGLYASDPEDMVVGLSLRHVLRELNVGRSMLLPLIRRGGSVNPPDACSFMDGLQTLPDAIYARHRESIRLNSAVRSIDSRGDGWSVATDGETVEADEIVLTVSAPVAAGLLRRVAPGAAARISALKYNPLGVVHLHSDAALHGLGYQVSLAEQLVTRGVTWNDSLFGRDGVYTVYLGGASNPWVETEPADRLGAIAINEFRTVTGADARVLSVARERMPAWDSSWAATQSLKLPQGIHIHANWDARPGIPGRLAMARRIADQLAR